MFLFVLDGSYAPKDLIEDGFNLLPLNNNGQLRTDIGMSFPLILVTLAAVCRGTITLIKKDVSP